MHSGIDSNKQSNLDWYSLDTFSRWQTNPEDVGESSCGIVGQAVSKTGQPIAEEQLVEERRSHSRGERCCEPRSWKDTHGSAQDIFLKSTYSNTLQAGPIWEVLLLYKYCIYIYMPDRLRLRHAAVNVPPCQFVRKTLTYPLQTLLVASAHFIVSPSSTLSAWASSIAHIPHNRTPNSKPQHFSTNQIASTASTSQLREYSSLCLIPELSWLRCMSFYCPGLR